MKKELEINRMFAERLKSLRDERNLSLRALAEELGVSYQAINYYENLQRDPSIWVVKKIADYFNVKIDWLIGNTDERT